jgi:hypothetical protein
MAKASKMAPSHRAWMRKWDRVDLDIKMPPKKILTALQSVKDVQRDQESDPICSSFPTTVLTVSGSRV